MRTATTLLLLLSIPIKNFAFTLDVGNGYPYATLEQAAAEAAPGDTILLHSGIYDGGIYIGDLQGTASSWIYILAAEGETVIFEGGTNAWQFTDAAYMEIRGIIFEHQTGNGLNFDDGGSYETPAHHILFTDCTFRDINASGNNDLLKLSGLDDFEITDCIFTNGAAGGSGIDMVGCHDGIIKNCGFENLGSNSIQAKGGTSNIEITRNFFKNGGARAVNLGGSTGLPFFRPLDAPYESSDLKVYSNVFIGSEAPIAFVGTINTTVVNNTIYLPAKWVLRILQETVDPTRFPPCGNNAFRNNIVYLDQRSTVECNIGPNTAPETFTFSNNLWYHVDDTNWPGPDLPVTDADNIVGQDPLFADEANDDFNLLEGSPAIESGYTVENPALDYTGAFFLNPRSIGAYEGGMMTGVNDPYSQNKSTIKVWPNPAGSFLQIDVDGLKQENVIVRLQTLTGQIIIQKEFMNHHGAIPFTIELESFPSGLYFLQIEQDRFRKKEKIVILQYSN
jgi:hypothetical protein